MTNFELEILEEYKLLAGLIYGEARGETESGKRAVAWVVKNRAKKGGWYGHSINSVILKPWQFSCFNMNDPNREKIIAQINSSKPNEDFKICLQVAKDVLGGLTIDETFGATHYYNPAICNPTWAKTMIETAKIGNHKFLK